MAVEDVKANSNVVDTGAARTLIHEIIPAR